VQRWYQAIGSGQKRFEINSLEEVHRWRIELNAACLFP
jgi:hypothetical protein